MSALVNLFPYDYEVELQSAEDNSGNITCTGTAYAANDDEALNEVERQYKNAKMCHLRRITVKKRWPDGKTPSSFSRYMYPPATIDAEKAEKEKEDETPKWELWQTEGLDFWPGALPSIKPFPKGEV